LHSCSQAKTVFGEEPSIVLRLIDERQQPGAAQHDLLSLLIEAQHEKSGQVPSFV
jgi:cytochrome P450